MQNTLTLGLIAAMVNGLAGSEPLPFDEPLKISANDFGEPILLWQVQVSPNQRVYVMNGDEAWYQVEERDTAVISALYPKVEAIVNQTKAVA